MAAASPRRACTGRWIRRCTALCVAALLGAACGGDGSVTTATTAPATTAPATTAPATTAPATTAPATTAPATTAPATTAAPSPTSIPVGTDRLARLWFVRDERLSPVYRVVPGPESALLALLSGPDTGTDAATAVPAGTTLRSYRLDGTTAVVDLSARFTSGGGTLSMQLRLGQVVATALEDPAATAVELRVEGTLLTVLGGEGLVLDQPLGEDDLDAVRPFVVVDDPQPGALVQGSVVLTGRASVFESTVAVEVRAADGRLLATTTAMAQGSAYDDDGNPTWAPFTVTVVFDPGDAAAGVVTAFERSAMDGSPQQVFPTPVRFRADGPLLTELAPGLLPVAS